MRAYQQFRIAIRHADLDVGEACPPMRKGPRTVARIVWIREFVSLPMPAGSSGASEIVSNNRLGTTNVTSAPVSRFPSVCTSPMETGTRNARSYLRTFFPAGGSDNLRLNDNVRP